VIGDTTVTCTADDSHGNHSSASFTVHVKDAAEQATDLRALVASWAIAKPDAQKLDDTFASVQASLADGRTKSACGGLNDAIELARKAAGRSLTTDQSARVVTDASRIRAALGC